MPQYVYYCLCRICHEVNTPDPPGICPKCQAKNRRFSSAAPPAMIRRPPARSHYQTQRRAAKTGALPWRYAPEPGVFCRLVYRKWRITIRRDRATGKFWYEITDGKESEYRRGIDELVSARIRSVRHLARFLNRSMNDLMEEIRKNAKEN